MTQEEIIEGNKLIAEFMGLHKQETEEFREHWIYPEGKSKHAHTNYTIDPSNLQYQASWDWLMPVIDKIESIYDSHDGYYAVYISSNTCSIQGTKLHLAINNLSEYGPVYISDPNAVFHTKIESTWYNVVQFIKWFNQKSKQQ